MNNLPDPGYLLDQLLHSTLDSLYFKDEQSRFIMYNQACAEKHGWKNLEEGIGKTDFDTFSGEHAEQAYIAEQHIISTGEPLIGIDERETWPDGRVTWCSSSKIPLRDETGKVVGILGITRDITARQEDKLRAERYAAQIAEIKEMLEEDARMAGKLQQSFFISEYPVFPDGVSPDQSCIEFLHHFYKCSLVSGDYCALKRLSDTKVSILLCDVLGKGARAALGAGLIRGIMQEISALAGDPSAYIERLNQHLYPLLHPESLLLNVTACYLVVDLVSGQTQIASAGHPLPLHFRSGQPAKWLFENLVLRGPALAVDPQARFPVINCRMQPGDSVVLFTDGLFRVKNIKEEAFSEKRLLESAKRLDGKSLGQIFRGLEDAATGFSREAGFTDDVILIGFHLRKLLEG